MKPVHRLVDKPMPGSFPISGLHYVQIRVVEQFSTGKYQVAIGSLKSPAFFTKEQADREFYRISAASVINIEDLYGYKENANG